MFELDTPESHALFESKWNHDEHKGAPHLKVTKSVKDAFQLVLAGKFRAVNFLAGATVNLHSLICIVYTRVVAFV